MSVICWCELECLLAIWLSHLYIYYIYITFFLLVLCGHPFSLLSVYSRMTSSCAVSVGALCLVVSVATVMCVTMWHTGTAQYKIGGSHCNYRISRNSCIIYIVYLVMLNVSSPCTTHGMDCIKTWIEVGCHIDDKAWKGCEVSTLFNYNNNFRNSKMHKHMWVLCNICCFHSSKLTISSHFKLCTAIVRVLTCSHPPLCGTWALVRRLIG